MKILPLALAMTIASVSHTPLATEHNGILNNKTVVTQALNALFVDFDPETARGLLADGYIQHNPHVPTGPEPLLGLVPVLKEANFDASTVRILSEGNLVVTHNIYQNAQLFGAEKLVAFDVFRVENGKLAEHWDNLQALVPAAETASGNSMIDGATEIIDFDKTAENKTLVLQFVQDILIDGKGETIADYLAPEYTQHNPQVPNGLDGLLGALSALADAGIEMKYHKTHLSVAEGNFVFTASEGSFGGTDTAFYDLFRVQDGKIIEHWDVVSEIPAESANANGKF